MLTTPRGCLLLKDAKDAFCASLSPADGALGVSKAVELVGFAALTADESAEFADCPKQLTQVRAVSPPQTNTAKNRASIISITDANN